MIKKTIFSIISMKKIVGYWLIFFSSLNIYSQINSIVLLPNLLNDKIISLQNYIKVQLTKKGFSAGHPNYIFFEKDRFHITLQQPENLDPQQEKMFFSILEKIAQEESLFDIAESINKAELKLLPAKMKKGYHLVLSFQPSEPLKNLANKIGDQFNKADITYKKYDKYAPHITIGYIWKEEVKNELEILKNTITLPSITSFPVNEIAISKGEIKDKKLVNRIIQRLSFGEKIDLQGLSNALQSLQQELFRLQLQLNVLV